MHKITTLFLGISLCLPMVGMKRPYEILPEAKERLIYGLLKQKSLDCPRPGEVLACLEDEAGTVALQHFFEHNFIWHNEDFYRCAQKEDYNQERAGCLQWFVEPEKLSNQKQSQKVSELLRSLLSKTHVMRNDKALAQFLHIIAPIYDASQEGHLRFIHLGDPGETLFYKAVLARNFYCVRALLELGFYVNHGPQVDKGEYQSSLVTFGDQRPLDWFNGVSGCYEGDIQLLQLLVDYNIEVTSDIKGNDKLFKEIKEIELLRRDQIQSIINFENKYSNSYLRTLSPDLKNELIKFLPKLRIEGQ